MQKGLDSVHGGDYKAPFGVLFWTKNKKKGVAQLLVVYMLLVRLNNNKSRLTIKLQPPFPSSFFLKSSRIQGIGLVPCLVCTSRSYLDFLLKKKL